MQEQEFMQKD